MKLPSSFELHEIAPTPINLSLEEQIPSSETNVSPFLKKLLLYLLKIQKYSAYTFTGFLGLHLTSVVIVPGLFAPLSIAQDVFEMSRAVYQSVPNFENIAIIGSSMLHVISGIGIRLIRAKLRQNKTHKNPAVMEPIITDTERDDIGLGGITALIGLGYKKSWIATKFPTLTPLSFSGYCLLPLVGYHFFKFRYLPVSIDGDSSLINLEYISYYLTHSSLKNLGNRINYFMIVMLLWVMSYHSVSGLLKYNKKYSLTAKKCGYVIINSITVVGLLSLSRFRGLTVDSSGYFAKQFIKYLKASPI
ncbi:uncharacterized protein PRCAT00000600001 [Priceomyces carsonii]|uniref:uncharacterized protein n=1 Tax=Priceomyces carsonii TaxID=28549 RepID=UPI002ED9921E|nr:unnamed protein product [Priceomyces carsonii]